MTEDTEHLCIGGMLFNTVMIIKSRLRRPTNVKCGIDVGLCPFKDGTKLLPIVNVFKAEGLNRRARDDHTVEAAVLDLFICAVKCFHMICRGVRRGMACGAQKCEIDLKGGIGKQADELRFRGFLGRHQVEHKDF